MTHSSDIIMHKIDSETGEEIPSTPEEQAKALAAIRKAIELGKFEFTDLAYEAMDDQGLTPEVIESWFYPKS